MIECIKLTKKYGAGASSVRVLNKVDLSVAQGTFSLLMGPSGSGKSTLIRILSGLETADSGKALVDGQEINALNSRQRERLRLEKIGVVFQDHLLLPELRAVENVELPLRGLGMPRAEAREHALAALALFGLEDLASRWPDELSGGQQQRVGIARATVGRRSVILADEPSGALDRVATRAVFAALREAAERGVTVLAATHDPSAADFADAVYDMEDGCLERRS